MKERVSILLIVLLAITALPAFAQGPAGDAGVGAAAATLRMTFPKMEFEAVHPTPIDGLFEVVAGDKVLYFAPKSRHLIVGEIWDAQGQSLTRERMAQVMAARIEGVPLEQALKIGDGKNVVIEVTDPDCPFCRKGSEYLDQREDITRYIFLNPLKMHPDAEKKSRFILAAENPADAYADVMAGRYDDQPLPEFSDNHQLEKHLAVVRSLGVRGTPKYWINGHYLSGADIETMERLLGPAPQPQAAN